MSAELVACWRAGTGVCLSQWRPYTSGWVLAVLGLVWGCELEAVLDEFTTRSWWAQPGTNTGPHHRQQLHMYVGLY